MEKWEVIVEKKRGKVNKKVDAKSKNDYYFGIF